MPAPHEQTFNVALGSALRSVCPTPLGGALTGDEDALWVETPGVLDGNQRADLLILTRDERVVCLEVAYTPAGAERDAVRRLGVTLRERPRVSIATAISVVPPDGIQELPDADSVKEALLAGANLSYAAHQLLPSNSAVGEEPRRWPESGRVEGTVHDLCEFAFATSVPKERVEATADRVARILASSARTLATRLGPKRAREIAAQVSRGSPVGDLQTTLLLWLNAVLVQSRLAEGGFEEAALPAWEQIDWEKAREVRTSWNAVIEQNWADIFKPAVDALATALRRGPVPASATLGAVIEAAGLLQEARLGPFVNVGAELFPLLTSDRKQSAAFYTQAGPAEFLAALAIPADFTPAGVSPVVADLACGTGTLLRAAYRRLRRVTPDPDPAAFHKRMMEHGLKGVDISPIAAHLTQSGLAAIGGATKYDNTQIGWIEVGGESFATGSLEYFESSSVDNLFGSVGGGSAAKGVAQSIVVADGSLDLVLINPPYSRTRGGQAAFDIAGLEDWEREGCQDRWKYLIRGRDGLTKTAGMAASFVVLAAQKVRHGGRVGFVLPLATAGAPTSSPARACIEGKFTDVIAVTVVAGKARGKRALSADTYLAEMMVVATRRNATSAPKYGSIVCATLDAPPLRPGEAGAMANAIRDAVADLPVEPLTYRPIRVGDDTLGLVLRWPTRTAGAPWSPVGARSPLVVAFAAALASGRGHDNNGDLDSLPVPMATIKDTFKVGPTHHRIGHRSGFAPIGAYEFFPIGRDGEPHLSLWATDAKTQRHLVVAPTHYGVTPADGRDTTPELRQRMAKTAGTLFYQRGIQWTSQALLAATTNAPVMGGRGWTSLTHEDDRVLAAAALWLNSTYGLLMQWHHGSRTQLGRSQSHVKQIPETPFPRLDALSDDALTTAAEQSLLLKPYPLRPACQAHADPHRHAIDGAVNNIFDIPETVTAQLPSTRRLWCEEPSVHGQNQEALALLADPQSVTRH